MSIGANRPPDVEAQITILKPEDGGTRASPVFDGYSPHHRIVEEYLTSGVHHYYDREVVQIGETVLGTISFLTPEAYPKCPKCLWVGKVINVQEGNRLVGRAIITKIFNEYLKALK